MGSAATYQLAKAGADVLGIDRYDPPHELGSTHGRTRITRLAIGEGSRYVPLVKRSHELWREIEAESGESLMTRTGGLVIAVEEAAECHGADDFLAATIAAAEEHGIEHELLAADDVAGRYPALALTGRERPVYYEPDTGFVRPERAVAAQLALARRHGATIRTGERVLEVHAGGVRSETAAYAADRVVVAAGPWVGELLPGLRDRFTVYRQVQHWFALDGQAAYERHRELPIFIWQLGPDPDDFVYGFPAIDGPDGGVKVASEQFGEPTTPDARARDVAPDEVRRMYDRYVRDRLPGLTDRCLRATTCLYTMTADHAFVVADGDVLTASACSGHGFKHSPAVGEAIAQLVSRGRSELDLSAFALGP
jgi:sarcosine oxidase